MKYQSGFGLGIKHNYGENYFLEIAKSNNTHKIWLTEDELRHLYFTFKDWFEEKYKGDQDD